jgi:Type II CAAX prenyl endopeptidase Rce1-like
VWGSLVAQPDQVRATEPSAGETGPATRPPLGATGRRTGAGGTSAHYCRALSHGFPGLLHHRGVRLRGYAQVALERVFPAVAAVAVSSVFFMLWHGPTQGFFWSKLLLYFLVGVTFGSIALLTRSILPALPAHLAGDLLFFFAIWPNDATRPDVLHQGATAAFWLSMVEFVVFAILALLAFAQLAQASRASVPKASRSAPARQSTDL